MDLDKPAIGRYNARMAIAPTHWWTRPPPKALAASWIEVFDYEEGEWQNAYLPYENEPARCSGVFVGHEASDPLHEEIFVGVIVGGNDRKQHWHPRIEREPSPFDLLTSCLEVAIL